MADDRTHLTPASEAWMSGRPASAAVRAGDLLFLSGQASLTDDGPGGRMQATPPPRRETPSPACVHCWRRRAPASTTCST